MKTSITKERWGVHASHCCSKHGCKYGDADCPVVTGEAEQKYPCESCSEEYDEEKMLKEEGYCTFKKIKLYEIHGATGERSGGLLGTYFDKSQADAAAPTAGWYGSKGNVKEVDAVYDEHTMTYYKLSKVEPTDIREQLTESIRERMEEEFSPEELAFISANIEYFKPKK